jgi:predicted metal-binding membrane protein
VSKPTLIESALRHERIVLAGVLALVLIPSWAWIVVMARDMYGPMTGASAWMMTLRWDATHVLLLWAMWAVMMSAMMLPAATPVLLLYGGAARGSRAAGHSAGRVYLLAAGYLAVWAIFSAGATAAQRVLSRLLVLTPMMEATAVAGGVVLLIAGAYQLTPLKRVCLRSCRSPMSFLMQRWRPGAAGAFRMGVEHGIHCVGCCWALMLLLFAGGVMNLAVILALTGWVLVEKLAPCGEWSARIAGVALLAGGVWMVAR